MAKPALPPALAPQDEFETMSRELYHLLKQEQDVPGQRLLFQRIFRHFPQAENGHERMTQLLDRLFEKQARSLAMLIKPDQMLALLELEDVDAFCSVVAVWKQAADLDRLAALRHALANMRPQPRGMAAAWGMARLAIALAAHRPDYAEHLLNAAYPMLPVDRRADIAADIEARAALGKYLRGMHPQQQLFWEERWMSRYETVDWSADRARDALDYLQKNYGSNWHGYDILGPLLPPAELQRLQRAGETFSRLKPPPPPIPRRFPFWAISKGILWMLAILWLVKRLIIFGERLVQDFTQP